MRCQRGGAFDDTVPAMTVAETTPLRHVGRVVMENVANLLRIVVGNKTPRRGFLLSDREDIVNQAESLRIKNIREPQNKKHAGVV